MKADVAGKPVQAIEVAGCDTIPRLFHHRVAEWGARTAFREKRLGIWRATSWHEYGDRAKWVGLGLVSLGLRRGEVVSILAETKPEWLYADMGVIGVGGVSNGIYPTDSSRQVEYILNDSGSRFLLVENEEQLDKYLDVRERCPQLRKVIVFDLEGLAAYRDPQVLAFDELLALGRNYETDHPELWDELVNASAPEKLVLLVYTSGTTGPPKGAMLCHRNVLFQLDNADAFIPLQRGGEQLACCACPRRCDNGLSRKRTTPAPTSISRPSRSCGPRCCASKSSTPSASVRRRREADDIIRPVTRGLAPAA